MNWAIEHWEQAGPQLVERLDQFVYEDREISDNVAECLFLTIHLCGEKCEKRAYPPICELLLDRERCEYVLGDAITETLPGILINVFDGDVSRLIRVIESPRADEFVRHSALDALSYLAASGQAPDFDMHGFLLRTLVEMEPQEQCYIWEGWCAAVAYAGHEDLTGIAEQVLSSGLVDPSWMRPEQFRAILDATLNDPSGMAGLEMDNVRSFGRAVETLSEWAGYRPKEPVTELPKPLPTHFGIPATNPNKYLGRNDPCPCGSGKKYKKCCLRENEVRALKSNVGPRDSDRASA